MEAFLVSITTISVAEIGDRTQLLSLLLAARLSTAVADHCRDILRDIGQSRAAGALGYGSAVC